MKKLKAFTLAELVVVMIISTIALATIYTVYLLVKKQYSTQVLKAESLTAYMQFKEAIVSDIFKADSVRGNDTDGYLLCYTDTTVTEYIFSERTVVRHFNNISDSFLLFPHNLNISHYKNSELVDHFSLKLIPFRDTVLSEFTKQYDANSLITIKPE